MVVLQFAHLGVQAVHTSLQGDELFLEGGHQTLQGIHVFHGFHLHLLIHHVHLGGDGVQTGIEDGSHLEAGHGLVAAEGAVRESGHASIGVHQLGQGLIGPVRGVDVGKIADGGTLGDGILLDALQIQLNVVGQTAGRSHHNRQERSRRGCNEQALKWFH